MGNPLALNIAALAVLLLLVARVGPPAGDFANYYTAAVLWWEGAAGPAMYDYRWFTAEASRVGFGDRLVGFAVLTPPSALFAAPLLPLSPHRAGQAWWLGQGALLVLVVGLLSRSLRRAPWLVVLPVFALWPSVQSHLYQGQFHLPAVVALAAGFAPFFRRHWSAGLWWGLAAGLKVHAWPLLVMLALCRRWRALGVAVATLAVGGGVSVALLGWPLHETWLREIAPAAAQGWFTDPWHPALQSVHNTARRLLLPSPAGGPLLSTRPLLSARVPAAVSALVVGWTLACGVRWGELSDTDKRSLLSAAAIAALVSGPILVTYHLTLLIPPVAWALDANLRGGRRLRAALIAVVVVTVAWIPAPAPPTSVGLSDIVTLLPRFWACLLLWGLLLPWRVTAWHAGVLVLAVVAVLGARLPPGAAGAQPLAGGQLPLIADELVWSDGDGLCWSGLASDRGDAPGRGWVGYCLGDDGVPRIVAAAEGTHVWAPRVDGAVVSWRHGAVTPSPRDILSIEGRGQVVVRDGDLYWVPLAGAERRLTDHPALDRSPVYDPQRERLWFLSDRRSGVRALRLWWLPAPWAADAL